MNKSILAGLFASAALLSALPAGAVEAIPESCLKCRQAGSDTEFIECLYSCLGSVKSLRSFGAEQPAAPSARSAVPERGESASEESSADYPKIAGWTLREAQDEDDGSMQRLALRPAENAVEAFFTTVQPSLVLARAQKSRIMVIIDYSPAALDGFSDRVSVQVDKGKVKTYRARVVWHGRAVFLADEQLLGELKKGSRLYVRARLFGGSAGTAAFSLKGVTQACRWLDEIGDTAS